MGILVLFGVRVDEYSMNKVGRMTVSASRVGVIFGPNKKDLGNCWCESR